MFTTEGVMSVMRMRLGLDVTRCSRLTPVMTSQRDSQLTAPTFASPVVTPRHISGTSEAPTRMSHYVTLTSELGSGPGHHQPLAMTDVLLTRSLCQD